MTYNVFGGTLNPTLLCLNTVGLVTLTLRVSDLESTPSVACDTGLRLLINVRSCRVMGRHGRTEQTDRQIGSTGIHNAVSYRESRITSTTYTSFRVNEDSRM